MRQTHLKFLGFYKHKSVTVNRRPYDTGNWTWGADNGCSVERTTSEPLNMEVIQNFT